MSGRKAEEDDRFPERSGQQFKWRVAGRTVIDMEGWKANVFQTIVAGAALAGLCVAAVWVSGNVSMPGFGGRN